MKQNLSFVICYKFADLRNPLYASANKMYSSFANFLLYVQVKTQRELEEKKDAVKCKIWNWGVFCFRILA